ncbi:MAG TPA: RNA polymerase sigma factor [Steroidobacteraceae bacterium]|nr:RNA polymerase sigma factor [Steroidobacteraceae bacterium]
MTGVVDRTLQAIWHMESAKIIAKLARMLRDVGRAEEIAQDAFVSALEQWPLRGLPENPAAWLMTTAKNRAIDQLRHTKLSGEKTAAMTHDPELQPAAPADPAAAADDDIADDLLRLIFVSCHPVLALEARVALTLRLLGGLMPAEIARAFLVSEAAIQQRIVRAKRTLTEAHVPFEAPGAAERAARLGAVLEVIYLIFNEGYAATAGADWMRPALCEEALRLGRVLAELTPGDSEAHGLVALMEIQASRFGARVDEAGEPILLLRQDRSRWDRLMIGRGLTALARAESSGGVLGPYALQAAIAACHARATAPEETDWKRIVALYDALAALTPSPVVSLNRAVAVSMAYGPVAALEIVDELRSEPRLASYHLLPSVRGDLLEKLGRLEEARAEFARAASLTQNVRERDLLLGRMAACVEHHERFS